MSVAKFKIVIVDDDKDICTVMRSGLERNGFTVTAFDDPWQALLQFKAKQYDKIVLDVRMPGITGFQLAKQIWASDPDARICFFSAFDIYEKEAKELFKDLQSVFFIKKPIAPNELAKRIVENMQLYK